MALAKGITIGQIEEALRKNGGFVSYAAKALGCSQANVSGRVAKSERLQECIKEIHEQYLDMGEHSLVKLMKEGNLGAICFYMKCKGKKRGYIERQELELDASDAFTEIIRTIKK